ncbi:30S ribosomal protein S18 [Kiritimatiella glycovorans]|uniref:Small ribosomal subunit protein bS18 n=1 Tax=Kiritimatiella glycovorans TaxID=1307763 RepID=A0A0G3EG98_9BACT|nr:30S ribosomal protein S18 [Kiritimatiella glycovorans]AKJ64432.1 30S ribosomal protein S18 [Kiritimatiella glycovorans]
MAQELRNVEEIDYKDAELLRKFMTEEGKITPRRITGATAAQQRQLKRAIRRARNMGLVP